MNIMNIGEERVIDGTAYTCVAISLGTYYTDDTARTLHALTGSAALCDSCPAHDGCYKQGRPKLCPGTLSTGGNHIARIVPTRLVPILALEGILS